MSFFGPSVRNGLPIGLGSIAGFGVQQFSPADLFANGEQGFWYDPSDYSTLFQDSAGTTPVTAVEQAVGLMLDKSKGLVLGSELVVNGGFSSGASWVPQAGWTISGGSANCASANTYIYQVNAGIVTQGYYEFTFTVTNYVSGTVQPYLGASPTLGTAVSGNGTYTQRFAPTVNGNELGFKGNTFNGSIDNVSIKLVSGNHAFQSSSTKRPVLRARYNLLTYSEQFDNGVWTKNGLNTTGTPAWVNVAVAPDGTTTADKIIGAATTAYHAIRQSFNYVGGVRYTISIYAKAAEFTNFLISDLSAGTMACTFDLQAGTAGTPSAPTFTNVVASIENVGNGWYRCTLTGTANANVNTTPTFGGYPIGATVNDNGPIYTGDGTSGLFIWGADLRPTSQATGLIGPTYQRIAAATDYDVVGFLPYLQFDGFDDALTTNSIDFSATDKVTLWAGVRKLSDAAAGVFAELSASVAANNGAFALFAPDGAAPRYLYQNKGTASGSAQATGYAAPITNVLTGIGDIAGDVSTLRVDGVQAATSATDQGTGNYGNYPLFIGARNQTSLYFNGWLTQLIGRGAATAAGQISATEQWVGQRTGVQL
jgi:hypothetical protein